ncbi:MAG TPA: flavodoxin [Clostridiales bacterium]|nr:flavodoxin [Clostridiales bacterium]
MSKSIILYKSKYGTTRKYAQWLSEALGCDLNDIRKAQIGDLAQYDTIIIGGGVYAGSIAGISFLHKHIKALSGKNIIVFAVGVTGQDQDNIKNLKQRNLRDLNVPLFYLQGALSINKLSFLDRTLCKIIQRAIAKKALENREPLEEALIQAGDGFDKTDKAQLEPIISYISNIDS